MSTHTRNKYIHETGQGYLGVHATDNWTVEISVATMQHIDWTLDTTVTARDIPSEPGLQLVEDPHGVETHCSLENRGHGLLVHVHPPVLRNLEDFQKDRDIRVYQYDDKGLTIVPRDSDPFIGGDH